MDPDPLSGGLFSSDEEENGGIFRSVDGTNLFEDEEENVKPPKAPPQSKKSSETAVTSGLSKLDTTKLAERFKDKKNDAKFSFFADSPKRSSSDCENGIRKTGADSGLGLDGFNLITQETKSDDDDDDELFSGSGAKEFSTDGGLFASDGTDDNDNDEWGSEKKVQDLIDDSSNAGSNKVSGFGFRSTFRNKKDNDNEDDGIFGEKATLDDPVFNVTKKLLMEDNDGEDDSSLFRADTRSRLKGGKSFHPNTASLKASALANSAKLLDHDDDRLKTLEEQMNKTSVSKSTNVIKAKQGRKSPAVDLFADEDDDTSGAGISTDDIFGLRGGDSGKGSASAVAATEDDLFGMLDTSENQKKDGIDEKFDFSKYVESESNSTSGGGGGLFD
eukprot:g3328.t1